MKAVAHKSASYPPRTYHNAKTADLTVAFAEDFSSRGEELTKTAAGDKYLHIDLSLSPIEAARLLFAECRKRGAKVLNIAGNGIYTLKDYGWRQEHLNLWMYQVLELVHKHWPLKQVISGGQTGVDFAGGVAGELLGLDPVMTFPKDYLQRTLTKYAHTQTEAEVLAEVENQVKMLTSMIMAGDEVEKTAATKVSKPKSVEDSPSPH
jgi:hypothetical protein